MMRTAPRGFWIQVPLCPTDYLLCSAEWKGCPSDHLTIAGICISLEPKASFLTLLPTSCSNPFLSLRNACLKFYYFWSIDQIPLRAWDRPCHFCILLYNPKELDSLPTLWSVSYFLFFFAEVSFAHLLWHSIPDVTSSLEPQLCPYSGVALTLGPHTTCSGLPKTNSRPSYDDVPLQLSLSSILFLSFLSSSFPSSYLPFGMTL